ncbi:MAG: hypothetical protein OXC40_04400, partial [Proteobacteria bacterium]|nr:hypothetical protein [Pseudomonadota bacterium]
MGINNHALDSQKSQLFHYRLHLAYDGRPYSGFVTQPGGHTIQDHLEAQLMRVAALAGRLVGASRTDAGVSAYEHICLFRSTKDLDLIKTQVSLNALLHPTIRVISLSRCHQDFHPLLNNQGKIYRYLLWHGPYPYPFDYDLVWSIPKSTCLITLEKELTSVQGQHDFKGFSKTSEPRKTTIRTLKDVRVFVAGSSIEIWFYGDGFLRHMIRNLIGSAVTVSGNRLPRSTLPSLQLILQAKDRTKAH